MDRCPNPKCGHDTNFQGYGRFLSDAKGQYYFRTIKPIDYTLIGIFRTAHIHFAISQNGRRVFTSQMLVNGHPANARDGVIKSLDPRALETLLVDFKPLPGSKLGELTTNFGIVLGLADRPTPCASPGSVFVLPRSQNRYGSYRGRTTREAQRKSILCASMSLWPS